MLHILCTRRFFVLLVYYARQSVGLVMAAPVGIAEITERLFHVINSGWLIDCLYGVKRRFQQYFSYIAAVNAPIHAYLELF